MLKALQKLFGGDSNERELKKLRPIVGRINDLESSVRDLSDAVIQDDVFSRLLTFPNVVITGHQDPDAVPRGVHFLEERRLYDAGLRYEDLVHAGLTGRAARTGHRGSGAPLVA